ncbi:MAG: radical SAM protein, partial [Treponema sp.]|nr:radical SAM protein [Treponema sp.]
MSEGTAINTVDPLSDIGALLLGVEKPCRYTGGEYGRLARPDAPLQTLIAFPDLYEIGMSNQALRIIYNGLNRVSGISCDRAFAPAPDFERLLRDRSLPLYGLDTGISLKNLDILLFTLGYELGLSGILAMLDVSGIPLRAERRGEADPLVICGGPAVSNPLPYSAFVDAFWIGEAEAGFFDLARDLLAIKQNGGNRSALFEHVKRHPNIWVKGKEKAVRAVHSNFALCEESTYTGAAVYPVPSMKIVQHHGILEIMRGCPNGCRFCHAGYWYRPMRQKPLDSLVSEAEAFISLGGYREISLSSLSSGDYQHIGDLADALNERFSGRRVSFQLPSLRVSTFALSLLEKISQTRRSGLTFAVETPRDFWQLALNKQVTADSVVEIIREAKRHGWRGAKFYFMIGLPLPEMPEAEATEEEEIVNFVSNVAKKTAMHFNVNVGIFVPKPHTPYQWARQIDGESAAAKLDFIRSRLKPQGHKVSVSDPLISTLEGILSRGDERAGIMAEQAFNAGSRLDAWQEFIDKDAW